MASEADKRLLELAGKAVGFRKDNSPCNGGGRDNDGFDISGAMVLDWHNNVRWNPLEDDGDALRLAVKLRLGLTMRIHNARDSSYHFVTAYAHGVAGPFDEPEGSDQCAAARRAIVRAAAEIGKLL